ncbi:MAG: VOC family protein [Burkholderiales bacterium]|nr:VOC family protein [Burkholderiales bacterium]
MKINKIDHVCIAVRDLEAARRAWEPILGKEAPDDAYVDAPEKIRVARYWLGGVGFELIESLAPDGEVAKFIERHGEGVMLVAFNVESTRAAIEELRARGYPIVGAPRPFRDCEYAFVHPKAVNGVLLEIIDYRWRELTPPTEQGALPGALARAPAGPLRAAETPPPVQYRARKKIARIHDPRRGFALTEIESEVREDPLTGETARICHFAFPPRKVPDLSPIAEATRAACPFCPERIESVTPRYPAEVLPEGRLRRGEALLFPNLFPYDDLSAIVAIERAHFVPMHALRAEAIADALLLARDFIARTAPAFSGRQAFGIVTWNYMPPSGASQVHPHLQVIVTDAPGNALARALAAETRFLERHGLPWPQALLDAERAGERRVLEDGPVLWWVPYCPVGMLGDAQALIRGRATLTECGDEEVRLFAATLARLASAYARLGHWSFNLTLFPDFEGAVSGRHWLGARFLPRFYLHPELHNSDVAYLQLLLGENFSMVRPEAHAAALREALAV